MEVLDLLYYDQHLQQELASKAAADGGAADPLDAPRSRLATRVRAGCVHGQPARLGTCAAGWLGALGW